MNDIILECPKCHSQMEQGFVLEKLVGGLDISRWVSGPALKSLWTGVKSDEPLSIPIGSFRCKSCGYLESYARDEFVPK